MATTNNNGEKKQIDHHLEQFLDGSTKGKPLSAQDETFHNAAERGQVATDQ
jgi:hypothetical protein